MEHEVYDDNSLVLAAEDFDFDSFESNHFFSSQDYKNISKLRAHGPVLLKGARGSGKSALMIESFLGLYPKNTESNAIGIYVSLRHLELLISFGQAYIQHLCSLIARETNRLFEEQVISLNLTSVSQLQEELIALSQREDKRIVLFFDDAAHLGREANLNEFFDTFRTISNSYISCKASIYPGVTRFGTRFDVYNDATVIDISRSEKSSDYGKLFEEVIEKRFGALFAEEKFQAGLSRSDFCLLFGQAVLGNMRAFIFACNEILNHAHHSKNISFSHVSESFKQLSSNYFWPLLEEIKPKLGMYESMIDPSMDVANIIFSKSGAAGDKSVIILREICGYLGKPLEILEYAGFISRREVSRVMKSGGRGTRYMLNMCILIEHMQSGRISADDLVRWKGTDEKSSELHRGSELVNIVLPNIDESRDLDILTKEINALEKSNIYPYGLTHLMIQTLRDNGIQTVQQLLLSSDEDILSMNGFGHQKLKRIRSTTLQAIWM